MRAGWRALCSVLCVLVFGSVGSGGQAIGCAGFGVIAGKEDALGEGSCERYLAEMAKLVLPRNGHERHPRLIAHRNSTEIEGDSECSGRGWLLSDKGGGEAGGDCVCFHEAAGVVCAGESERAGKPLKAAVVYLLYGSEKYFEMLREAIRWLSFSFLEQFPYPIVVFHSANFARVVPGGEEEGVTYLDLLREVASGEIRFVEIEIDYREEHRARFAEDVPTGLPCGNYSINYMHMGRFFQYLLFRHAALDAYDYVWRLDGDFEITLGIPCDVFDIMLRSRATFGYYYYFDFENHLCGVLEGRNAAFEYAARKGISPNHLQDLAPQSSYHGLWGVFQMSFWRSKAAQDFGEFMDATALAYTHRLGEQAYYALVTGLLVSPVSLHQYAGLGPFIHRTIEIVLGNREVNGLNMIRDDVFCPEASEWDCNEIFECSERSDPPPWIAKRREPEDFDADRRDSWGVDLGDDVGEG